MKLDEAKQAQIEALYEDAAKRNAVLDKIKSVKGRLKIFDEDGQLTVNADELEQKLGMNQQAQKEDKPVRLTAIEKALKSLKEAKNAIRRLNYEECNDVEKELKKLIEAVVSRRNNVLDEEIEAAESYLQILQAQKAAQQA